VQCVGRGDERTARRERPIRRHARGLLSALPALLCLNLACGGAPRVPLVLLITLDTTRADHLGMYGYARPTTPHLDRLARDAVVYERAVAPGTWTLPSHASLFTGKAVSSHGAQYDPEGSLLLTSAIPGPEGWGAYRARGIARDERTLATLLQEAGYTTGAVVAGPWLKRVFGLDRGFDFYDDDDIGTVNGRLASSVTDRALAWIDETSGPRFLFLNYFDPHAPFVPPPEHAAAVVSDGAASGRVDLYDGEIHFMDHHIGRLLEGLRTRALYDDALIVVTADHGELLGEHGEFGHGDTPYEEVIHVPLLVKEPGGASGRRADPLQLTDVYALILDRVRIAPPPGVQGQVPPDIRHPIVVESRTLPHFAASGHWLALIDGDRKLVWNSEGAHMLFDLAADPEEQTNLVVDRNAEAVAMAEALEAYLEGLPPPGPQEAARQVDAETEKALESLGYLE
jgi:arylsulfatase A-like enzyme